MVLGNRLENHILAALFKVVRKAKHNRVSNVLWSLMKALYPFRYQQDQQSYHRLLIHNFLRKRGLGIEVMEIILVAIFHVNLSKFSL